MHTNDSGPMMPAYARPTALTEALSLVAAGFRVLAGGTDLYPAAATTLAGDVVDVSALTELHGISAQDGWRIGAATRWSTLAEADLPPALQALQQAARQVGGRQVQNAGTLGGNLCHASPAADGIPPLLALGAELELASPRGLRRLPLQSALIGPRQLDLTKDEILLAIHIPPLPGRSAFRKLGARSHLVISIAMAALWIAEEGGRITRAAAALGACGPTACRLPALEAALIGQSLGRVQIDPALIQPALAPIDDIRATAAYRRTAAVTLLRRLTEDLAP